MKSEVLALIPARSGSQRVINKNIRSLGGRPLIDYTIDAARNSSLIARVIVSTDSEDIGEIAKRAGAEVPFLRPMDLANAESTEFEYHLHAVKWLEQHENYRPELIVNLYPTTPFRTSASITKAIQKVMDHPEADGLRSTRKVSEHPYKMWVIEGNFVRPFINNVSLDLHTSAYHLLPPVQIQNASIYIIRTYVLERYGTTIGKRMLSFEMDERESVDINTNQDFRFAEMLLAEEITGDSQT